MVIPHGGDNQVVEIIAKGKSYNLRYAKTLEQTKYAVTEENEALV